ncbi:MAG: hypothetical protein AB7Q42_05815 [Acidimicrobiia bacterium]
MASHHSVSWEAPTGQIARPAPLLMTQIVPSPTDEEVAVIAAAVEAMWPKPVVVASEPALRRPVWRFSGRWWSKPVQSRRDRPGL